jgi:hypothetical protein
MTHIASSLSRRMFIGAGAAATLAACETTEPSSPTVPVSPPTPPAPATQAYEMRYSSVIDTASTTTSQLKWLMTAGVRTIFRYYATAAQPEVPQKQLTEAEANAILDAGMSLAIAFQYYNNRKENIHAERGKADGATCLQRIETFRQPQGSAIYFGIDGDWPDKTADIVAYFTEVSAALKPAGYRVGVYGSGVTCKRILDEGLAELSWLAYAPAWSGSAAFYNSNKWTLFQAGLDTTAAQGLRIDTNLIHPSVTDFGQWSRAGVGQGHTVQRSKEVAEYRRFIASKTAKLYAEASEASAVIENARFRKSNVVRLVSVTGDWAQVDVNETGKPTGWCRLSALTGLSVRPDYFAAG